MKCNQHAIELPLLLLFLRDVDVGQKTSHSEPKIHYILLFFYCILLLIQQYFAMAIELLTTFLWLNNHCIIIAQFSAIVLILELCTSLGLHLWNLMGKKLGTCSRPKLILDLCSEPEIQQVALNADKIFWTFFLNLVPCFKLHFFYRMSDIINMENR